MISQRAAIDVPQPKASPLTAATNGFLKLIIISMINLKTNKTNKYIIFRGFNIFFNKRLSD